MKTFINIKCPHCQFKDSREVLFTSYSDKEIVTCNIDAGGCDKDFIIMFRFIPQISYAKITEFSEEQK